MSRIRHKLPAAATLHIASIAWVTKIVPPARGLTIRVAASGAAPYGQGLQEDCAITATIDVQVSHVRRALTNAELCYGDDNQCQKKDFPPSYPLSFFQTAPTQ